MSKFTKQHYEVIADAFNESYNDPKVGPTGRAALFIFLNKITEQFKRGNVNFKESKFEERSLK